jgi:hypothetical protein
MSAATRDELHAVFDLHTRAYETVLWLHNASYAHPELLTEQTATALLDEDACRQWARDNLARIPQRLRPAKDVERFACLFASFFQTSFRVERRQAYPDPPHFKIVPVKDRAGRSDPFESRARATAPTRRKRRKELTSLKREALHALAPDAPAADRIDALLADPAAATDVALWAYGFDLVARSCGRPHGPAGHLLWRELDEDLRKNLTADIVWAARDRLLAMLR